MPRSPGHKRNRLVVGEVGSTVDTSNLSVQAHQMSLQAGLQVRESVRHQLMVNWPGADGLCLWEMRRGIKTALMSTKNTGGGRCSCCLVFIANYVGIPFFPVLCYVCLLACLFTTKGQCQAASSKFISSTFSVACVCYLSLCHVVFPTVFQAFS